MQFEAKSALRLLALLCACLLAATVAQARTPKTHKSPTKTAAKSYKAKSSKRVATKKTHRSARQRSRKPRGQQQIDAERTREIQTALIREHYLDGEATGDWDQETKEAMTRYQADHGWQTKVLPDARALISLGLGPSQSNLLNPQTAALPRAASSGAAVTGMGIAEEPQHR